MLIAFASKSSYNIRLIYMKIVKFDVSSCSCMRVVVDRVQHCITNNENLYN